MNTTATLVTINNAKSIVKPYKRLYDRLADKIESNLRDLLMEQPDLKITIEPNELSSSITVQELNNHPSNIEDIEYEIINALNEIGFSSCQGEVGTNCYVIPFEH